MQTFVILAFGCGINYYSMAGATKTPGSFGESTKDYLKGRVFFFYDMITLN